MKSSDELASFSGGSCRARRRASLLIVLGLAPALSRAGASIPPLVGAVAAAPSDTALRAAMRRAYVMRDEAVRAGDQPYGAVVLCGDRIVGAAPSRVIATNDPFAHAETQAIREAERRLGRDELSGCWLISSSRPCRVCEARARSARIERMIHGEALTDAGAPT